MKDYQYFCSHLFTALSFDQKGNVRICCNNSDEPRDENGDVFNVYSDTFKISDAMNSESHIRIRKNILDGNQDSSCFRCWQTEDNNAESYRTIWNSTLASGYLKGIMLKSVDNDGYVKQPFITFLDFTLGNKCNLVCRMCNLENSDQWDLESDLLGLDIIWDYPSTTLSVDDKFLTDDFFYKNFMHVKHINFLGGEPLIIKEHYDFLKQCIKLGIAKNIVISYTTNLIVIKKELKELWKHFRHISVGVSVDGVGEVNDYIRYPSKWKNITKNIEKISEFRYDISMDIQIHATFQLLNLSNWDKLMKWTYSLGDLGVWRIPFSNWVTYPEYYDCRLLPKKIKDESVQKINKFIDSKKDVDWTVGEQQWLGILKSNLITLLEELDEDRRDSLSKTVKEYNRILDMSRGQHIKDYIPELEKFIYG
jgi:sulfatase maturation enzyme AslB (radical SAM superfamily)